MALRVAGRLNGLLRKRYAPCEKLGLTSSRVRRKLAKRGPIRNGLSVQ